MEAVRGVRVLVTGGVGFIGSHLCDRLAHEGHDVTVLDDLSHGDRTRLSAGTRLHVCDAADASVPAWIADEARPEVVFHLAAQMDVRKSMADPAFDARVNVLGSLNVIEGARRAGSRAVVFASTGGAVYGEDAALPIPTPESATTAPVSIYGASKLAVEKYLHVYAANYGLSYTALRFANVYGPRQDPHGEAGVVAIFCERLLAGRACTINGDGGQTRDYVFVLDVVDACVRAMALRGEHILNIGTGVETDVCALQALLAKNARNAVAPVFAPGKTGEQRRSAVDAGQARRTLGWTPNRSLDAGLAETWRWFEARQSS